jgi:hypothetical protein
VSDPNLRSLIDQKKQKQKDDTLYHKSRKGPIGEIYARSKSKRSEKRLGELDCCLLHLIDVNREWIALKTRVRYFIERLQGYGNSIINPPISCNYCFSSDAAQQTGCDAGHSNIQTTGGSGCRLRQIHY